MTKIPKIKDLNQAVDYYGKTFIVKTISKEDLQELIKYPNKIKDWEMTRIAEKLGDALQDCYWDSLEVVVESYLDNYDKRKL